MQKTRCRITLTSHGAIFSHMAPMAKAALWDVVAKNRNFKFEWNPKTRRNVKVIGEEFFFIPDDRRHVAIHRNQLEEALLGLKTMDIHDKHIEWVYNDDDLGAVASVVLKDGKTPRDYQVPIVKHAIDVIETSGPKSPTACLPVQTGRGKTLMALFVAEHFQRRIGVVCASKYTEKWQGDLAANLEGVDKSTVITIGGCAQLISAFNKETDFKSKGKSTGVLAYIISLETLNSFIKRFILKRERFEGDPHTLFQTLGIGFVIKDEVHELFHMLFKTEVYTHARAIMALSATIEDKRDKFKERMYHTIWPKAKRYDLLEKIRYTDVYSYTYNMPGIQPYSYQRQGNYSHNKLEESLTSNKAALESYVEMVGDLVEKEHMAKRKEGEKCIIYASMNGMVEHLSAHLTKRYPNLVVGEYIRQDPLANIIDSDITVTSPTKAAAALDVPNLATIVNTVNTGSQKRIVQTAGRLRELKKSSTRYIYTHCNDIPKHFEYHKFTREVLNDVVKTITVVPSSYTVRFVKNKK